MVTLDTLELIIQVQLRLVITNVIVSKVSLKSRLLSLLYMKYVCVDFLHVEVFIYGEVISQVEN